MLSTARVDPKGSTRAGWIHYGTEMIGDIIQPTHLLLILLAALLVLGPKRLPGVGRSLGRGLRDFRHGLQGMEVEARNGFTETDHPTDQSADTARLLTEGPFSSAPAHSETSRTYPQATDAFAVPVATGVATGGVEAVEYMD